MIRHLPNLLSALRLLAAPFAAWLIVSGRDTAALCVFALAGASDGLDGFIARHWGAISRFGAWLDPVADKLLMLFCFIALLAIGAAPAWLVMLVAARDAAIAGGWLLVRLLGLPVRQEPLLLGKITTAAQVLYVFILLLLLAFDLEAPRLATGAAWACGLFTLLSGAAYAGLLARGFFAWGRTAS
ncbi:MAG TPA: CDP-alcohol phosphatidyltransferase family protein [Rhizomicrobium sp.]|jgi:cardiolipin synthase|nr:CDP-alcohol phosphatidyltransferase family protein [Rhizomicrobium sp.]